VPRLLSKQLHPSAVIALATLCAAAGLLTIYGSVLQLLGIWLTDDLKSMGMVVPFVSFLLILRAWRSIGWQTADTPSSWWGFALLAGSAALMFLRDQMLLIVTVDKDWLLQLPPLPLVAVLYGAGMVLLLGGTRLLKAAWFPVLFLWAVIPVPQTFSRRIDLPLQHASASVARAWAHLLGQPLTQDKLRLMFTPEFGMFIAPGCNGIRGAITLGLAAIVVGYLYRFRWFVYAPVVVGAILLGYVFNFLRLCLLVVYYKLALPSYWMQHHARNADFVIGGLLFLCALAIFFTAADKLRHHPEDVLPEPSTEPSQPARSLQPYLLRVAAVLLLATVFGLDARYQRHLNTAAQTQQAAIPKLPARIGNFTLTRTWNDTMMTGVIVYIWGEYATPDIAPGQPGPHVSLGISPDLGVHDAEVCHIARGEDPTWHGQITAPSAGGEVELTAATYNDGVTQKLEASTVCDAGECRQYSQTSRHVTLVYARPHRNVPLLANETRAVPVLIKVESLDTLATAEQVRPQLEATLQAFLKSADLAGLASAYGKR
jgi:exosortase J